MAKEFYRMECGERQYRGDSLCALISQHELGISPHAFPTRVRHQTLIIGCTTVGVHVLMTSYFESFNDQFKVAC